jgi:hypothetical protein
MVCATYETLTLQAQKPAEKPNFFGINAIHPCGLLSGGPPHWEPVPHLLPKPSFGGNPRFRLTGHGGARLQPSYGKWKPARV